MSPLEERQEVIRDIENAFSDVQCPPPSELYAHDPSIAGNARNLVIDLGGKTWEEVPYEVLKRNLHRCYMMSGAGFAYWLPAFMLASVTRNDFNVDQLVFYLTFPFEAGGEILREEWIAPLSRLKREAVLCFLKHLVRVSPEEAEVLDLETTIKHWETPINADDIR